MSHISLQIGNESHTEGIRNLYLSITEVTDGIIRNASEISMEYVSDIVQKTSQNGLCLVALQNEQVVGEIHAYTPQIFAFQHLLTDLTIMVHPQLHSQGIGKQLFTTFLARVQTDFPHILRVELYVREHNERNVRFYERLGFKNEGRQANKIYIAPGQFQTPLHMAWVNPGYKG